MTVADDPEVCLTCTRPDCEEGICEKIRGFRGADRRPGGCRTLLERKRRLDRYLTGWPDDRLAEADGVSIKTIRNWRRAHDLPPNDEKSRPRW